MRSETDEQQLVGFMTIGSAPWHAQFTAAQLAVIVEEAGRVDKPVAAHVHGIEGIRRPSRPGSRRQAGRHQCR